MTTQLNKFVLSSSLLLSTILLGAVGLFAALLHPTDPNTDQGDRDDVIEINKTSDFDITGDGSAENWSGTEWVQLNQLNNHEIITYSTRVKVLYSDTGLYVLFECEDARLTATMDEDFMELWHEDVIEIFLWPEQEEPVAYFEYELSPLNYELPILVSNKDNELAHWQPYSNSYTGERKVRHETTVSGGEKSSGASVDQWTAEIFIPFDLLRPLKNIFPEPGTEWRANLYRIDYDDDVQTSYAWQPVSGTFHEYQKFGTFVFSD